MYEIPPDHAGGTHWFHNHHHETTEVQVAGGAVGMLIIEDDANAKEVPQEVLDMPTFDLMFFKVSLIHLCLTSVPFYLVNQYPFFRVVQFSQYST